MYFETFADLLYMEGHGPFVWASYAFTTAIVLGLILSPLRRSKKLLAQQRRIARRDAGASKASN